MVARWKVGYTQITWCAVLRLKNIVREIELGVNLGSIFNGVVLILTEGVKTGVNLDFLVTL